MAHGLTSLRAIVACNYPLSCLVFARLSCPSLRHSQPFSLSHNFSTCFQGRLEYPNGCGFRLRFHRHPPRAAPFVRQRRQHFRHQRRQRVRPPHRASRFQTCRSACVCCVCSFPLCFLLAHAPRQHGRRLHLHLRLRLLRRPHMQSIWILFRRSAQLSLLTLPTLMESLFFNSQRSANKRQTCKTFIIQSRAPLLSAPAAGWSGMKGWQALCSQCEIGLL